MKKMLCWLLCGMLVLSALPALAQEAAADMTVLGATRQICTATVNGDVLTVTLEENPTTGYTWQYDLPDGSSVTYRSDEFILGTEEGEAGVGGTRVFTFKGTSAGETELVFSCTQAFDPLNVPASSVTVKAAVTADGAVTVASCEVTESAAISAKPLHLDDTDEDTHMGMALGLGNTAELLLTENPSTGYTWQVTLPEDAVLAILTDSYIEPVGAEDVTGAAGTHQWLWDARKAGETTVTAVYARVWESEEPLYTVSATYAVDEDLHVSLKDAAIQQSATELPLAESAAPMASDGAEGSITFKTPAFDLFLNKTAAIKPISSEKAVKSKGYTFISDDESIASVDKNGKVKAIAAGSTTILVTSKAVPSVWARVPVNALIPVKKISVTADASMIYAGETVQLTATCDPADASRQSVTWKSSNKNIASVDENGLVTGLKKGNVNITATAQDGSKAHGSIKLTIGQKAESVSIKSAYLRVGVGMNVDNTAIFAPKGASKVDMVWTSSDESIATVTGKGMNVRCHGQSWGQCTITGTTPDGALSTSFTLNVGSLRKAVVVKKVSLDKQGLPVLTIRNDSPLTMSSVTVAIRAYAYNNDPLPISKDGDGTVLQATYNPTLDAYTTSSHDFKLIHVGDLSNIGFMEAAVIGWTCEEGYQSNKGDLLNKYTVSENNRQWVSMHTSDSDVVY